MKKFDRYTQTPRLASPPTGIAMMVLEVPGVGSYI